MLTYDRRFLAAVGLDANRDIRGLVGLSGPYDFLPLRDETLKVIFGPEEGRGASQPINFVTASAPPALLATGGKDRQVDPGNTPRMAKRIGAVGGRVETRIYPHIGHEPVIGAFSRPFRWVAPVLRDAVSFVTEVTAMPRQARREAAE
jgi:acetyl esterase/lipase